MGLGLRRFAVLPLLAAAAACHLFIGREADPLPACVVPSGIADLPVYGAQCKACLEVNCCDKVGDCPGSDLGSCGRAFANQLDCIRTNLGQSNDNRPQIPSWIRSRCNSESEQTTASKAAAGCMVESCAEECFPRCASPDAADCVGRRCRLAPELPSLAGSGCDERVLESSCCEVVNDCLADRPCLNAVRCLERASCLYAIGLSDPAGAPCAREAGCFLREQQGKAEVALPLLQALQACIPKSGACVGGGPGDAGPRDATGEAADSTAE